MTNRYISVTDTAKIIRKALKEAFPEIKFSVRCDKYAGGSSIDVDWTDGPATAQVEPIAKAFQGGYFDGMTDYKGGHEHEFNGEKVHFGGDFVHCHREISKPKMAALVATIEPLNPEQRQEVAYQMLGNDWHHYRPEYDNAERLAWLIAHNVPPAQFANRESKLAASAHVVRSY